MNLKNLLIYSFLLMSLNGLTQVTGSSLDKSNESLSKYERIGLLEQELSKTNNRLDSLAKELEALKAQINALEQEKNKKNVND